MILRRIANVTGCSFDYGRRTMSDKHGNKIRNIVGDPRLFVESEIAEGYVVDVNVHEDDGLAYFEMEDDKMLKAEENTITIAGEDDTEPQKTRKTDYERRNGKLDPSDYLDGDDDLSDIDKYYPDGDDVSDISYIEKYD